MTLAKNTLTLMIALAGLNACMPQDPQVYANRTDPENLLSYSSEVVSFDLSGKNALTELKKLLKDNPPTRAMLNCDSGMKTCSQAKALLSKSSIPTAETGNGNDITMVYEDIVARDCENRYIDNSNNPYNLNHSTFGCSMQANMVQMVTDKRQFVNPDLLDYYDGEKAAQDYQYYMNPPEDSSGSQSGGAAASGSSLLSGSSGQ
jgi:hypothetical protein